MPGWSLAGTIAAHRAFRCRLSPFSAQALCVDSPGLLMGYEYARHAKVPLVYLSFEIAFCDELTSEQQIAEKERERIASQAADLIIIQDEWRAKLLVDQNQVSPKNIE